MWLLNSSQNRALIIIRVKYNPDSTQTTIQFISPRAPPEEPDPQEDDNNQLRVTEPEPKHGGSRILSLGRQIAWHCNFCYQKRKRKWKGKKKFPKVKPGAWRSALQRALSGQWLRNEPGTLPDSWVTARRDCTCLCRPRGSENVTPIITPQRYINERSPLSSRLSRDFPVSFLDRKLKRPDRPAQNNILTKP